jgi:hypothetical protein
LKIDPDEEMATEDITVFFILPPVLTFDPEKENEQVGWLGGSVGHET